MKKLCFLLLAVAAVIVLLFLVLFHADPGHHFSEAGTAAVQFPEGDWGFINTEGLVMERGMTEEPWENENELGYYVDEDNEYEKLE